MAFRLMDEAWELCVTTFDTADAYGGGRSETFIGDWLRTKSSDVRGRIVVATKTFNPMEEDADQGLADTRIRRQIDSSLTRLGVDRVALYMPHTFDLSVPQEETLVAFDELVRAGKVGSVGASNFPGERLAEAIELSEREGLTRYEWVQNSFSLLDQEDRETIFPLCHEHGLGYTPFSPLAGGWLTGKYRRDQPPPPGSRMSQRPGPYEHLRTDGVFDALERLEAWAELRGVPMAAVAIAWLLHLPEVKVTAVVVGPNRIEHLEHVREALELRLTAAECDELGRWFT